MPPRKSKMPGLIRRLYKLVAALEAEYGRKFTPDGHLVGSIGEVLGATHFGLTLLPHSATGHDAVSRDGKRVEIKATQGKSVALRSKPDYLVVLTLSKDGTYEVIYNGPGAPVWAVCGKKGSNGQHVVRTTTLRRLQKTLDPTSQLAAV